MVSGSTQSRIHQMKRTHHPQARNLSRLPFGKLPLTSTRNMAKILTKSEVAKYLQISERKIDYLRQAGQLLCVKIGRNVRFRLEDVEEFVRNGLTVSTETKSPQTVSEPMGECRFQAHQN